MERRRTPVDRSGRWWLLTVGRSRGPVRLPRSAWADGAHDRPHRAALSTVPWPAPMRARASSSQVSSPVPFTTRSPISRRNFLPPGVSLRHAGS